MYLGIDTSNNNLCYALLDHNKKTIFHSNQYPCNNAAEQIAPRIAALFQEFNITIDALTQIISVAGPGGFSGVRIGTSFIAGLVAQKNIPIVTLSSLEANALSITNITQNSLIISCLDARRNSVYLSIYDHNYHVLLKEQIVEIPDLGIILNDFQNQPYFITGHGCAIVASLLNTDLHLNKVDCNHHNLLHYSKAELFTKNASIFGHKRKHTPIYLRKPDAKISQKKFI